MLPDPGNQAEPEGTADEGLRIAVLAIVRDDEGRVLLVRSARRPGRWELPGGAVRQHESPMAAVLREVAEEARVAIGGLRLIGLYYGYEDGLLRIVFAGDMVDTAPEMVPNVEEILEIGWFDIRSLPRPMPRVAHRMLADSARRGPAILATVAGDYDLTV